MTPEQLARLFHETFEQEAAKEHRLKRPIIPWNNLDRDHRRILVTVFERILRLIERQRTMGHEHEEESNQVDVQVHVKERESEHEGGHRRHECCRRLEEALRDLDVTTERVNRAARELCDECR
jgi:hypothetical protein